MSIPPVKPMMNVRRSLVATLLAVTVFGVMMLPVTNLCAQSPQQQWVGDLPIMAGMTIEPELGFAFDSPGGRIVLVFASSSVNSDGVFTYYNDALASLGWVGSDGNWERGNESLGLAQVDTSVGRLWRIRLSPR